MTCEAASEVSHFYQQRFEIGMLASMLWIRRQYSCLVRFLVHGTCGSHEPRSHTHKLLKYFLSLWDDHHMFCHFPVLILQELVLCCTDGHCNDQKNALLLLFAAWWPYLYWPCLLGSSLLVMEVPENGWATPNHQWRSFLLDALANAIIGRNWADNSLEEIQKDYLWLLFLRYLCNGAEIHFNPLKGSRGNW